MNKLTNSEIGFILDAVSERLTILQESEFIEEYDGPEVKALESAHYKMLQAYKVEVKA
jgi:hypothetical protein